MNEKLKLMQDITDMFYNLNVCACRHEVLEEMDNLNIEKYSTNELFNYVKNFYIDITCNACSDEVIEEFDIIEENLNY